MSRWKVKLLQYGVTGFIAGMMAYLALWLRDFSTDLPLLEQYRMLSDAFTIPGVILIMVGFLVMIANAGNLMGVAYTVGHAIRNLVPFANRRDERYYDYYKRKKEQGKVTGYGFIFITGAVFMAVSLVFYALFYMHY